MSRSYKKTPIGGNCVSDSERYHKTLTHRNFRRVEREGIYHEQWDTLPTKLWQVVNPWNGAKDGKAYHGHLTEWCNYRVARYGKPCYACQEPWKVWGK